MNPEIANKIEDIQQVINAWHGLHGMYERCKNAHTIYTAQRGLDNLIIALLKDVVELYRNENSEADDSVFDVTVTGTEEIIQTAAQILFSRNGFIAERTVTEIPRIKNTLADICKQIDDVLITIAEELVKAYTKERDNETT